jgi:hypothetical protein
MVKSSWVGLAILGEGIGRPKGTIHKITRRESFEFKGVCSIANPLIFMEPTDGFEPPKD